MEVNTNDIFHRVLLWRERHIPEKTFVVVLALIVGTLGGFAALLLKWLVETIAHGLTSHFHANGGNPLYFVLPPVGVLIALLFVRYLVRDNISHGVTRVLHAISQNKSRLKRHNMFSSLCASSVTIGFGGSVGAEGPIVFSGAAIGSTVGQLFRMSPRVLMILVGCGAAAGIAGIFKAPIAGMLFTLEVLMIDLTTVSVMPLLVASIAGVVVSYAFTGYEAEFFFAQSESFETARIPFVIMLGVFCGLVSLYFTRMMNKMENFFGRITNQWKRYAIGAVILSCLVFFFPPLYGEGYTSIISLLQGTPGDIVNGSIFYFDRNSPLFIIIFVAVLILAKAFATSATTGAGGVGGTFAPSLFVGCMAGFL